MVLLFIDRNTFFYFYYFGIEYISQEILNKIRDKSIIHNIFRIYDNDCIMYEFYCIAFIEYILSGKAFLFYCIGFIEYILSGKAFLDYTDLLSQNDYKK